MWPIKLKELPTSGLKVFLFFFRSCLSLSSRNSHVGSLAILFHRQAHHYRHHSTPVAGSASTTTTTWQTITTRWSPSSLPHRRHRQLRATVLKTRYSRKSQPGKKPLHRSSSELSSTWCSIAETITGRRGAWQMHITSASSTVKRWSRRTTISAAPPAKSRWTVTSSTPRMVWKLWLPLKMVLKMDICGKDSKPPSKYRQKLQLRLFILNKNNEWIGGFLQISFRYTLNMWGT